MSITVKFFASIREKVGKDTERVEASGVHCVGDVWHKATDIALPPNTLMAVNQEYARADQDVRDGDEVAFFPPVTGG